MQKSYATDRPILGSSLNLILEITRGVSFYTRCVAAGSRLAYAFARLCCRDALRLLQSLIRRKQILESFKLGWLKSAGVASAQASTRLTTSHSVAVTCCLAHTQTSWSP